MHASLVNREPSATWPDIFRAWILVWIVAGAVMALASSLTAAWADGPTQAATVGAQAPHVDTGDTG